MKSQYSELITQIALLHGSCNICFKNISFVMEIEMGEVHISTLYVLQRATCRAIKNRKPLLYICMYVAFGGLTACMLFSLLVATASLRTGVQQVWCVFCSIKPISTLFYHDDQTIITMLISVTHSV